MSLNFNTGNIADRTVHFPPDEDGKMNDDLHILIWLTMPIGINHFTEKNIEEVWRRVDIWQKVIGSGFTKINIGDPAHFPPDTSEAERTTAIPYVVSKEAVFHAIGLYTNATAKTRSQFLKDLWEAHTRTYHIER